MSALNLRSSLSIKGLLVTITLVLSIVTFSLLSGTRFYHHMPIIQALVGWGAVTFLYTFSLLLLMILSLQKRVLYYYKLYIIFM